MHQYTILLYLICWQLPSFAQLLSPEALATKPFIEIFHGDKSRLDTTPLEAIYRLSWHQYEPEPDDHNFEELSKMINLQALHFYLYDNRQKLPAQVLKLENLEELSIKCNDWVDATVDLKQIKALKRLGFTYYPQLYKHQQALPLDIAQLPHLEAIALDYVEKIIPTDLDKLAQLPNLKELYLQDSWFDEMPVHKNTFQHLKTLMLFLPNKYTSLPRRLDILTELEELIIQAPLLTKEDFAQIVKLKKLKKLTLYGAEIDDLPKSITQLQALEELNFIHTTCDNWQKGIQLLSKLPNLKKIVLPYDVGESDYSSLHSIKEVGIWQDYDVPSIIGVIELEAWFRDKLDLEYLLPSLQTFPKLEQVNLNSGDLDFMNRLIAVLDNFDSQSFSPLYNKKKAYLDWLRSKLHPASLQQLENVLATRTTEGAKSLALTERVHLLKHIKSLESTLAYGNTLIQDGHDKKLETAKLQDIEAVVYYYIGYQYQQQKKWKEAINYLEKSLAIRQQRGDQLKYALLNLANLYREKGDWDNFERHVDLIIDATKQEGYHSLFLEAIPQLFEEKNYEKAKYFFDIVYAKPNPYFSMTNEDAGDFFYRILYKDVVRQGTIKEQHDWIKRWVKFIDTNLAPFDTRKVLREVINDFFNDWNYQEAAYYTQQLIDYEREQCSYDQSKEALEFLHYALRLKCYILMSNNQLVDLVNAYIKLITFQEENSLASLEVTLYGLNELSSKIYYGRVSQKQGKAVLARLKKWQKIAQQNAIKEWLNENIELIEGSF